MKKIFNSSITFLLALLLTSCGTESVNETDNNIHTQLNVSEQKLIQSGNAFGLKLFNEINNYEGAKNIFISPLSVSMALGMTYNGAANQTRDGMHTTLEYGDLTLTEINAAYKNVIDLLYSLDSDVAMKIANSLWANENLNFIPEFIQTNRDYFYAEVENVNFSNPVSTDRINNWVDNATNNKIEKIFDDPLDPATAMVLVNAIYFKGTWTHMFDPELTYPGKFNMEDGRQTDCMMMSIKDTINYYENETFRAADLPYGKGDYSMTILLPKEGYVVDDIIGQLNDANWQLWTGGFAEKEIDLRMPKFKLEYELKMNDVLSNLGMGIAFTGAADFTNMRTVRDLFISLVKHKSFIEVNEEGTEAAAVTAVVVELTSVQNNMMRIDHPFFFVIRENVTGTLLFMGKITEPRWSE